VSSGILSPISGPVASCVNPHALDHLTHLWQCFRRGEERFQATDANRAVTGRNQKMEEFFRVNAKAIGAGQH